MISSKLGARFAKRIIAASLLVALVGTGLGAQAQVEAAERRPAEIVFVHGEKQITVNGKTKQTAAAMPVVKGVTMIPIQTIAGAIGAKVYNDANGTHIDTYLNKVTLKVNMRGAKRNGGYVLLSSAAVRINGSMHVPLSAVKQLWAGSYTFNQQLKQIAITIQPDPNVQPVADFTAPLVVKQGEPVVIEDLSYDPDGKVTQVAWTGRQDVYFAAGSYTVSQSVYDNEGVWSAPVTREINVTDEVLYTPMEYYLRYGKPSDKFTLDNTLMKSYPDVATVESRGGRTLYMSNAPERFFDEGLLYEDVLDGASRLFIHHINGSDERRKLAVVATNESHENVTITIGDKGLAGPSVNALQFGFAAVKRYLAGSEPTQMIIPPYSSVVLFPEMENIIMHDTEGFSGLVDIDTDGPLLFSTMALNETTDPLDVVGMLPQLEKVGNRGTFPDSDQIIEVTEPVGITESKLYLGNRGTTMNGFDALSGVPTVDGGEYGAVSTIKLTDVAYGTRIIFNPRAGNFLGAVTVNGEVVSVPSGGYVKPGEGVLLYIQQKPEDPAEQLTPPPEVTITYTSPGASSLPVLLVFLPGSAYE